MRALLLSFFAVAVVVAAAADLRPSPIFLISDVHFDPFYGTPEAVGSCQTSSAPKFGTTGCDVPLPLLQSSFENLAELSSANDGNIILYLGDVVRHKMKEFENSSASSSSSIFAPDYELVYNITLTVFGTLMQDINARNFVYHPEVTSNLGNEDCTPDYHFINSVEPSLHPGLFLHAKALIETGALSAEEGAMFQKCAFYSKIIWRLFV